MPTSQIIEVIYDLFKNRADRKDQASRSFHKAELDTRSYLARLRRTAARDFAVEKELSDLWNAASIDVARLDKSLSRSCRHFAQYWVDPAVPPLVVAEQMKGIISEVEQKGRERDTIWLEKDR